MCLWMECFYLYSIPPGLMCHLRLVSCLDVLPIDESRVLKSPTITESLSLSPFAVVTIFLIYWGAPALGAYIYLQLFYLLLELIPWSLCSVFFFLNLATLTFFFWLYNLKPYNFILKSVLSAMRMATTAFFLFPFAWNTFFHPLTFNLYVSLGLRWVSLL